VIHHVLHEVAEICKPRLPKELSLLRVARCCTVLRSRWCQSGVRRSIEDSLDYKVIYSRC
jgi:hypothetical protein